MSTTLLQQIRDANKSFLAGTPRPLDAGDEPFIVVACIDPRLTCLLESAMGLPRNRAIIIRIAGNKVCADDRGVQRSIAAGMFVKHAKEIFVVGHTDCAMSKFSAAEVAESFRRSGVPRTAFGDDDLRSWFGAFADVKTNVADGIQFLKKSGLVPSGVKTHGIVLDTATGAVDVIWDGDIPHAEDLAIKAAEPEPANLPQFAAVTASSAPAVAPQRTIVIGEDSKRPMSIHDMKATLKTFVARERGRPEFHRNLVEMAMALRDKKPARIVSVLDQILSRYESQYPDLRPTLDTLKSVIESKGQAGFNYIEFLKMVFE